MSGSFGSRNMPPPSPSQQYQTSHNTATHPSRAPASAPSPSRPFGSNRELPSLSSTNRPSSGMSISSMIEPESPHHARASLAPSAYFPPATSSASTYPPVRGSISERSPPHKALRGSEYGMRREPYAPDEYSRQSSSGPRETHPSTAASPRMLYYGPAEGVRQNTYQPLQTSPVHHGRDEPTRTSGYQTRYDQHHPFQESLDRLPPPRSTSQPINPNTTHVPPYSGEGHGHYVSPINDLRAKPRDRSRTHDSLGHRPSISLEYQHPYWDRERDPRSAEIRPEPARARSPSYQPRRSIYGPGEGQAAPQDFTGKRMSFQHDPRSEHQQLRTPPPRPGPELIGHSHPPQLGMPVYNTSPTRPGQGLTRRDTPPSTWHEHNHHQLTQRMAATSIESHNYPNHTNGENRREDQQQHQQQQQQQPPQLSETASYAAAPYAVINANVNQIMEDIRGNKGNYNESQQPTQQQTTPRSLLAIHPENSGRKGGRNSPLPQAVQGAQSQLSGPGDEPGIKSEFGRMFSGIGSGVGIGSGSGALTPSNGGLEGIQASTSVLSPRREIAGTADTGVSVVGGSANDALPVTMKAPSKAAKRSRKIIKDDHNVESGEGGRGTPDTMSSPTRGSKRNKHGHHHHHHHQLGHHHHHHPLKIEEEAGSPSPAHQSNRLNQIPPADPSTSSAPPTQPTPTTGGQGHTHSHQRHHHHHHHHNPPATTTNNNNKTNNNPPSIPAPKLVISSSPVLKSISHLPRHHLGSTIYQPHLSPSPLHPTHSHPYTTHPQPLPFFPTKPNSTFTIRVPCAHLTPDSRSQLIHRRPLWGTEIYTDDSDVLAAAMHAGFIRGSWDLPDPDVSLLLSSSATTRAADAPPSPPEGKDASITVLILPPLERYASSVRFGVRSRAWGDRHDGMSFMILRLDWLPPRPGLREERGGEARRKRLRASAASALAKRVAREKDEQGPGDGGGGVVAAAAAAAVMLRQKKVLGVAAGPGTGTGAARWDLEVVVR
ncbi:MAG: hypothetical protein M1816_003390 [Peltula sp. TS41687]|nr:MAG: hypothetical protein M1816_003390 [Peltula sp. TS41687]